MAGLILEGGGMRGLFTAGVLDYFLDQGISFPSIYAVSAGACHACSYLSGQRGRAFKTVYDFVDDKRYASFYSLLTTGDYIGVKFTYHDIPENILPIDFDAFEKNDTKFYAAVTNCATGQAEYHQISDLRQDLAIVQASSSLPILSRMVPLDGGKYLDGGIADSIPIAQSVEDGNIRNVVILTQHRGFVKEISAQLPLFRFRYRRYPNLVATMEKRHDLYNAALERLYQEVEDGNAFVIQPADPVHVGRMEKDREKLRTLYDDGYRAAEAFSPALRDFLAGESIKK